MSAYRPPEKSALQKLSENLFVQLALVALIGLIAVTLVTKNHKQSFWTRVQFLRGSSSTQFSQSQDANQFSTTEQDQTETAQNELALAPETTAPTAEVKSKAAQGSNARIYYLEIPQSLLSKWLEEGILTRVETSYEITIGYIPQLAQALEKYKSQIKVLKEESYTYNLNQLYSAKLEKPLNPNSNPEILGAPTTAVTGRVLANTDAAANTSTMTTPPGGTPGANPPGTTPGIVTYATLDDDRNDTLSGQLEVSVNPQTSFPAQFEMTADQSFFISGFDKSRSADRTTATETVVVLKIDK